MSAWFSTHYGLEVSYSKNWVFPSDTLWFDRWTEVLSLGSQFLEIITVQDPVYSIQIPGLTWSSGTITVKATILDLSRLAT